MNQNLLDAYNQLDDIIKNRKAFEDMPDQIKPYISHKTTLNYQDANGRTLLQLAIALGDKEKVVELYGKGARIPKAIETALKSGHCEIAKYLYNQSGEDAKSVSLCDITDPDCRKWFIALLNDKIKNTTQSVQSKATFFNEPTNKLFIIDDLLRTSDTKSLFDRIAELGDVNLVENLFSSNNSVGLSWCDIGAVVGSMLTHAASNNHLPLLKHLIVHDGDVNSKKELLGPAILAASKTNSLEVLDFLIANGGDINSRGDLQRTPLLDATLQGHLRIVEHLISNKADLSATDSYGCNLLHHAVLDNNPDVIQFLLKQSNTSELLNSKNIYGMTPLDFAIDKNYTTAIKLLDPNQETPDQHSTRFISINQNSVMAKMRYYLASKYRDFSFFSEDGHCNGFSFLRDMYENKGDYYYDTLKLMAGWDGSQEALDKPFDDTMPQAKYYNNLGELFEQWINDIIWFQHTTLEELYSKGHIIDHDNREFQYQVVGKDKMRPVCIFNSGYGSTDVARFHENIEIFGKRLPSGTRLEIKDSLHATSAFINDKQQFSYYDPNFNHKVAPINDPVEFANVIINTRIIASKKLSKNGVFQSSMYFFYYDDPTLAEIIEKHAVFTDEELPRSEQEAKMFQEQSPNGYTHLHVAVLTGSITSVTKILSLGFTDIDAKNKMGLTALAIAVKSNNEKIIEQLLKTYSPSNRADCGPFLTAYEQKNQKIIDISLRHHDKINLIPIFLQAIKEKNRELVKRCLALNAIDVNQFEHGRSALTIAMSADDKIMVELLLHHGAGASLFAGGQKDLYNWSSPLKNLVKSSQEIIEVTLAHLRDLDQVDSSGKSLIHYLTSTDESRQKLIIRKLVERKANLLKHSSRGETLLDIIDDDWGLLEDQKLKLYKLIIPNIKFDINNLKDQVKLKKILIGAIKADDNELINSVLPNVNSNILNSYIDNDVPLLLFACAHCSKAIIEKLLERGVNINCTSVTRHNSCLHILVERNMPDIIKIFLEKNADITVKNSDGKSALNLADELSNEETRKLFQDFMCTSSQVYQRPGS
jgi:ankyrin repeat protein